MGHLFAVRHSTQPVDDVVGMLGAHRVALVGIHALTSAPFEDGV